MKTWKCSAAALSLLVFGATSAMAGPPPYDNSNDTVTCGTILKGVIKPKPVLTLTGATPAVLAISGTLSGCTSPSNPNLVFPEGKSKFKGTINAPTNNCTALAGVTTSTGTITITWGATDSVSGAGLLNKTSTVTLPSMSSSGAFSVIAGDQHGDFTLGPPNVALSVAGGFRGPGGSGAASSAEVITTESVTTILRACDTAAAPPAIPGKGLKQIGIGVGRVTLQ
jgi:hypothetical protein